MAQVVGRSFDMSPADAPLFYATNIGMTLLAGLIVLIPGAPLMTITINANLLATILMPAALVFLLILSNDREIMGDHANRRVCNILGVSIAVLVALAGAAYAGVGFLGALGFNLA
jgi:Mn2+/Fe2+ NRAMP family transporter